MSKRGQRVGGFARLRYRHEETRTIRYARAIAVLARDLHVAREPSQAFDPITGDDASMVTRTARDDVDRRQSVEKLRRFDAENFWLQRSSPEHIL